MPRSKESPPQLASLRDLPGILEAVEGFPALVAALDRGEAGTVDGAWNSSAALTAATLALKTPQTLLVVLAHPRDVDLWIEDLYSFSGLRSVVFPAWSVSDRRRPRASYPVKVNDRSGKMVFVRRFRASYS